MTFTNSVARAGVTTIYYGKPGAEPQPAAIVALATGAVTAVWAESSLRRADVLTDYDGRPAAGTSTPALVSASTRTSSAIAQLSLDRPDLNAARLALPVVYAG